jgi:L-ascorbate metabolism protein UlaG (beta-lactamase superfamily)
MSALPPKADIRGAKWNVRFGPEADTGDTDVFEDMKLIPMFHHVDVMLACIGGYFTMDPQRAALAVQFVKPDHVIPMHFGTYPVLAGTPDQFRAALKKRHLADKLIVMKPGEDHSL